MVSRVLYFAKMFGLRSSGGSYEKLNEHFDLDTPFFQVGSSWLVHFYTPPTTLMSILLHFTYYTSMSSM
ncbi:hypothetical protein NFI96_029653 [Prochilodus magdalenae]|nr:hypothetical protein NFI96_029653 [Prochilodus magdalenae]